MGMHNNKFKTFNIYENTPNDLKEEIKKEFGDFFDPCPENPSFDGLAEDWKLITFVNPPYGKQIKIWLEKGLAEIKKLNTKTLIYLLPAYTDVKWFHDIIIPFCNEIRFIKGRLKFGSHKECAPFGSMIVIFKDY